MANAVTSLDGIRLAGLSSDFYHQLQSGAKNLDQFALFLQGKNPFLMSQNKDSKTLIIAESDTLERLIVRGVYDLVNEKIVKRFSFNKLTIGEWEYRTLSSSNLISSKDARALCEADGWQAGALEHLLVFGAMFPEFQRANPLIALGSEGLLGGGRRVPGVWGDGSKRGLDLDWWGDGWHQDDRFLSVRKVSST